MKLKLFLPATSIEKRSRRHIKDVIARHMIKIFHCVRLHRKQISFYGFYVSRNKVFSKTPVILCIDVYTCVPQHGYSCKQKLKAAELFVV
jgi:hypothetical protein